MQNQIYGQYSGQVRRHYDTFRLDDSEKNDKPTPEIKRDKISAFLNQKFVYHNKSFPFLELRKPFVVKLYVSLFYPDLNLAIDKIEYAEDFSEFYTKEKKELCKKNGIKYVFLLPTDSLAMLAVKIKEA